jgi:hypothetical protein
MKSQFSGETMIFAKEHNGRTLYSTSISKKNGESFDNAYIDVSFRKGMKLANKTKIDVKNGWLTFWLDREQKPHWQIFINEFECESQDVPRTKPPEIPEGFAALEDDDDIPF